MTIEKELEKELEVKVVEFQMKDLHANYFDAYDSKGNVIEIKVVHDTGEVAIKHSEDWDTIYYKEEK